MLSKKEAKCLKNDSEDGTTHQANTGEAVTAMRAPSRPMFYDDVDGREANGNKTREFCHDTQTHSDECLQPN